ncbi:hypothetical protein BaRGS_00012935, partial [Batillaria attramentaria]
MTRAVGKENSFSLNCLSFASVIGSIPTLTKTCPTIFEPFVHQASFNVGSKGLQSCAPCFRMANHLLRALRPQKAITVRVVSGFSALWECVDCRDQSQKATCSEIYVAVSVTRSFPVAFTVATEELVAFGIGVGA